MRPTHKFTTSGGHTLVINDYITGAENWEVRSIYARAKEAEDVAAVTLNAERKGFELMIVSIDGRTDNVADAIMQLPLVEYREVIEEITPIAEGKKKSETPSNPS